MAQDGSTYRHPPKAKTRAADQAVDSTKAIGDDATGATSPEDNTSAEGSSGADDTEEQQSPPELEGLIQGYVDHGTPLRRQLRSIGEKKRLRLMKEGIITIEGLAAIDTTNAELCMRLSSNRRADRAIRSVTEWKNEAQRFLNLM